MSKPRKKFKDTKVGKFLLGSGSKIADIVGDLLPDSGVLGVVKNLIDKDDVMPAQDKETALKLLEQDIVEMQEISKRWESDMKSDSWLSKNTRPMTLIYLTVMMSLYIILDSLDIAFNIDESWVELLKTLLVTIYVAYFGSRGFEKYNSIKK
jgi:endonuclease/exonuclease/phosphatase (EEP) superfamily protein YafD